MSTVPSLSDSSNRLSALVYIVAARAVLWIAWLVGVLLWAPRVENVLHRLNVALPSSMKFVVVLTHGPIPNGLIVVVDIIVLDAIISYRLRRSGARALWSGLMNLAPFAAIILTVLAVGRPMLLVLEHIAK